MNGTADLEGSMAPKYVGFGVSQPGCGIAQISAERWGAATGDEVATHGHGVFPLTMAGYGYGKGGHM